MSVNISRRVCPSASAEYGYWEENKRKFYQKPLFYANSSTYILVILECCPIIRGGRFLFPAYAGVILRG